MEKRQERDRDGVRKEHTTKLITPQVAKLEHTYRPGKALIKRRIGRSITWIK